jgi:hypothetical protein
MLASFPYTSKESKCGDVYGYGKSEGITDVDDCLGSDHELRSDGEYKRAAQHCRVLGAALAAKDDRCRGEKVNPVDDFPLSDKTG